MRLTLIQPRQNELYDFSHPERRFTAEQARRGAAEMVEQTFALMEQAPATDLVVTSEAVNFPGLEKQLPVLYPQLIEQGPLLERFAAFARARRCYVAAAHYAVDGGVRNRLTVFDRQGEIVGSYDKVHLAGEEQRSLTTGDSYCVVETDFGRMGLCICWDMQFPEVCRHYALAGARLVICPTWGWESIYAHARAYENGIFVAGAMSVPYRGGIAGIRTPSEAVAPDGTVLACADGAAAQQLTAELDLAAMEELHALRMHDRRPDTYGALVQHKA